MVFNVGGRQNVRILLVGERSVGKTSIILSLVSEEFTEDVPAKAEEITIPPEVTPEKVATCIVDYSAVEQTIEVLTMEIQRAHVVCIVYAVDDEESFEKVSSYWLPLLRNVCSREARRPVVLVGNKTDLIDVSTNDPMFRIMEEFPEVESCVACSAKTLNNISEMFVYAQKAVLHPTSPLYTFDQQQLTEACQKALVRIFKLCDADNDGLLNDVELNSFQRHCFGAPLQPRVLDDVKVVLRKNISDGVVDNAITLRGFLFLHCLFIQRGRIETTWTVLRMFGYMDNLEISKEFLRPHIVVPAGCTTELSHKGQQFLLTVFERFDSDRDGALSPAEVRSLFTTCPVPMWGPDIHRTVPTNSKGWITLQGFMSQWVLVTLLNLPRALEYLAYLGYPISETENQLSAIQVTRDKKLDLAKKQSSRSVYQCHVIGPPGSGKSMFCRSFIGDNVESIQLSELEGSPQCTVNAVQVYGQEKFLILRDIEVHDVLEPLKPSEVQCDVACLLYDVSNPKSFEYSARIYLKYFADSKIPILIVATKSDLEETRQDYLLQPAAFCSHHKLPSPQPFTASGKIKREIFVKLSTMSAFPRFQAAWMLFYRHRHLKQLGLLSGNSAVWWKAGLGIVAATAVGLLVAKALHSDK
ncbi:mitochondrial Rho GTPase isoform X2 [Zootermopsis nevadensis]|uniref:Mitochondrial Rho GTPase n=1 Tax=Zootermopsis nevadensis TaxID=136037 RepID=A0A067QYS1_ZOONE|nr:mitochondrial Rho GTPase isoform X2 [Zootermopsis nevadensis]KDR15477.1 Mitochondrial Rho GTPase [Zootermopsis nevadensis]